MNAFTNHKEKLQIHTTLLIFHTKLSFSRKLKQTKKSLNQAIFSFKYLLIIFNKKIYKIGGGV